MAARFSGVILDRVSIVEECCAMTTLSKRATFAGFAGFVVHQEQLKCAVTYKNQEQH